jgi:hypothetical protein
MQKGWISILLGVGVSGLGLALLNREKPMIQQRHYDNPFGWGVVGFGLAHILLGSVNALRD